MDQKIAIIGIGKLGLCFALNLERTGFQVLGIDIDQQRVEHINEKTLIAEEPLVEEYLRSSKYLRATSRIEELDTFGAELIFIMVATPATPEGGYSHDQILGVLDQIEQLNKPTSPRHLVIACTVMPGFCNSIAHRMAACHYTVNYNPEFIAQGSIIINQQYPDQLLIGEASAEAGDRIENVLKKICRNTPVVCRMDPLSAEIAKLATNCFLTMKISFANSVGDLAQVAGANIDKILAAVGADSRIGSKYLRYGFGYGGPCFPRDNRAFQLFAQQLGRDLPLSKATDMINAEHLEFQKQQWLRQYPPDVPIRFEGVGYKENSCILEESQPLKLAVLLAQSQRKVIISDTEKVIRQVQAMYGDLFLYETRP